MLIESKFRVGCKNFFAKICNFNKFVHLWFFWFFIDNQLENCVKFCFQWNCEKIFVVSAGGWGKKYLGILRSWIFDLIAKKILRFLLCTFDLYQQILNEILEYCKTFDQKITKLKKTKSKILFISLMWRKFGICTVFFKHFQKIITHFLFF